MSYNSIHTKSVLAAKIVRVGTEYDWVDEAFGTTSMVLFQAHDDLTGNAKFTDDQILVAYVRARGVFLYAGNMVGYTGTDVNKGDSYKQRLIKLNGETAYRIIRAINRAKAVTYCGDADQWRSYARFEFKPVMNAYVQEQLATGTGPKQYFNRMGGPNAGRQVFEACWVITKKDRNRMSIALEMSLAKVKLLLMQYNLLEISE